MSKPLYVIGHRNPDTDSVCSAIAYAHLKTAMGEQVRAARAGKLNAETKFVLDYFGVEAPLLVADLYPRARDVMHAVPVTVNGEDTLWELGRVLKRHGVKSVPVVTAEGRLSGFVSVGDLAKRYIDELEMQDLKEAGVKFAGVLRVLDGTVVAGGDLERAVTGKIWIAAAETATMAAMIQPGGVVIVGNREDAQIACIARDVACLIVTGGAAVAAAVRDAAGRRGVVVMTTAYDTYTAARLINQSIPVRMIMERDVVAFGVNDLVADIKNEIVRTKHRNYPVLDQGLLAGVLDRDRLIVPERTKVILVDHNERSQAVDGIEEANIVEIVDHHRLGGLETGEPIFIRHDPVGSTATIVASMHWHRGVDIPPQIAGLLLAAVLSDTLLFRSPTATIHDREAADRLAAIAGLDVDAFGQAMFAAGAAPGSRTPEEVIAEDLKEFQIGEYRVAISQTSVTDPGALLADRERLQAAMEVMGQKEDYDLVILMVTDIVNVVSHLICAGQAKNLLAAAFGSGGEEGVLSLPGVMSRKKQVVPPLVEVTRE